MLTTVQLPERVRVLQAPVSSCSSTLLITSSVLLCLLLSPALAQALEQMELELVSEEQLEDLEHFTSLGGSTFSLSFTFILSCFSLW